MMNQFQNYRSYLIDKKILLNENFLGFFFLFRSEELRKHVDQAIHQVGLRRKLDILIILYCLVNKSIESKRKFNHTNGYTNTRFRKIY